MTFSDSQLYCESLGSELLSIHSNETQKEAVNLCRTKNGSPSCWIGLHQPASEDWEWTDGSDTDYGFNNETTTGEYPWASGQPDNYESNEDCIHLFWSVDNYWNDVDCSASYYPICGM